VVEGLHWAPNTGEAAAEPGCFAASNLKIKASGNEELVPV